MSSNQQGELTQMLESINGYPEYNVCMHVCVYVYMLCMIYVYVLAMSHYNCMALYLIYQMYKT